MTTHTHTLTVEFDRDGERVYAYIESNTGDGFIRDFSFGEIAELDNIISQSQLIEDHGRWDGETSTKLNPAYEGRSCTTGGRQEIYGLNYFDHASIKYV